MKSVRFRHFIIVAVAAVLAAGCAGFQFGAGRGGQDAARRVIAAYDVSRLLAQADMVLTRSLMAALPEAVGFNRRNRLRQIIDQEFEVAALTATVQQQLAQRASQSGHLDALAAAAAALETPLARRLLGLQSKAGNDGFANGYNAFLQQPPDARRKARLQQIKKLMRHMGIVDVQSAFHLTLLKTMVNMRNALTPPERDIPQARLQKLLEQTRRTLRSQLRKQVPFILLYVYRNISDADLRKYVEMQSSPALAWTNRALVKAIRRTLEQAGKRVWQRAEVL